MTTETPVFDESEVPYDVAYDAHRNTSFTPDRRARQRQREYVETLTADFRALAAFADTPEKGELLVEEFERYRRGFRERYLAHLHAASRAASSMITGPANFPVASNRKRLETEHRRLTELLDFRKRALQAIQKKLSPERGPIQSADPEAAGKLQTKLARHEALRERMRKVNDAHKRFLKDPASLDQSGLGEEDRALVRDYKPAYSREPHPFPPYALANNGAEIRRLKGRIGELEATHARPPGEEHWGDVTLSEDPGAMRLRLAFPGKPDRATVAALKAAGFKWAPSRQAWQRHLNAAGRAAAEALLGKLGKERAPDGAYPRAEEWHPPPLDLRAEAEEEPCQS